MRTYVPMILWGQEKTKHIDTAEAQKHNREYKKTM